jgi:hypothetical protein
MTVHEPARDDAPGGRPFRFYRGLKTLSIMPTYTCTAACSNCASLSSPEEKAKLPAQDIHDAISEAKALGFFNVVFTGGEATLRWPELLGWIAHANKLGFPTRVVTNAHWATRLDVAQERIDALAAAGLSEINYSTGDEHVKWVPIERVANAMVAARRRGMPVHVMIEMKDGNTVTRDTLVAHPILDLLTPEQRDPISIAASPWMPLEHDRFHQYPPGVAVDDENFPLRMGCDSVLQTYTMQATGEVAACCGLGMRLIPELQVARSSDPNRLANAIAAAETDFLKLWLHYEGPERILAWAATHDPSIEWRGLYSHHCQFFQRLYHDERVRTVIRTHWEEVVGVVLQSAWLDEHAVPETVARVLRDAREDRGAQPA